MADFNQLLSAFVTLFVIIDPPGMAPIFIGLTSDFDAAQKRKIALRAALIGGAVLAVFALAGKVILDTLGITIPAFRVAGGLMLFWIAAEMVFERRVERKSDSANKIAHDQNVADIAAFPLAVPLMAGPGAITAVILLTGDMGGDITGKAVIIGLVAVVMLICVAMFIAGVWLDRFISESVRRIITRLLGVILSALAVQFVADGVRALAQAS